MRDGYRGRIVRVDLTTGDIGVEPLPGERILRSVIGGTGLALHYLLKETPAGARATDPVTPLIFMTGPLTGTAAPSSSNYCVVSLHFDVPYAAGTGHSHGFWGAYLKFAGYDGVIVRGRAREPVYLWIDDARIELRDARALWGKDTRTTEREIKGAIGGDPELISVACIGPGGEALLHGGMIKNDRNHGAGKGSPGSVMGAKQLKAIAVRGTGAVSIARGDAFLDVTSRWEKRVLDGPADEVPSVGQRLSKGGITRSYHRMGDAFRIACRNLTDPERGRAYGHSYVDGCRQWIVTPQPSYNCKVECAYDVHVTSGPFAGAKVSLCGGGENTEGAAAMIGVEDPAIALLMTDFYDAMGLESSTAGAVVSMAFEAYNRGLIGPKDTGGLELSWGNHEAAMTLVEQMIRREGFGAVLAPGLKEAAAAIGRGSDQFAVHIKGAGINLHDWRPYWSVLFGEVIAGAGPCWQAPGVDTVAVEPDLGYVRHPPGVTDDLGNALAKVEEVRRTQFKKLWEDCLGVCWFACWGVRDVLSLAPEAVGLATGWTGMDAREAMLVGERVTNLMRLVYLSRGFQKSDELDVSPRLLEPPPAGPARGKSLAPFLRPMVDEYYRQMDWDVETGRPALHTLRRLGLEEYAGST